MNNRFTRIILVGDDGNGIREFTISHLMVWLLGILGMLIALALLLILLGYGKVMAEARQARSLAEELADARSQLAVVDTLQAELRTMGAMQQQLLFMLGVEADSDGSSADTSGALAVDPGMLDPAADPLGTLATMVMTDPPSVWPCAGFITREFTEGAINQGQVPHPGLDIAGPEGAPILAAGDGLVARAGTDPFLGNFVEIQHGMGYLTVYGHCRQVAVARGAEVRRGQVIAYLGETGEASAPHLHFEVWHHGAAVDPRRFLQGEPPQP